MNTVAASTLTIRQADYGNAADGALLLALLDAYARDPMGGGKPLTADVRERLLPALAAQPGAFSLLAFDGDEAVGLADCLTGFSTFKARPLINIHDMAVLPEARGKGVGRALMHGSRSRSPCARRLQDHA